MNRREFLKISGSLLISTAISGLDEVFACIPKKKKYGMLIDASKCNGCNECVKACAKENNLGMFGKKTIDNYWIRIAKMEGKNIPLLCNHCSDAPCVRVCPVKASFIRDDGIVLVDAHRCIGCRYCMIACPYKARSFVFKENKITNPGVPRRMVGVAGMCNFCVHRVDKGLLPVCVEVCPNKVFTFGDLNNINLKDAKAIREDLRLKPKVYYLGI
ncbi:MAG: sulfate reduction electron transfer complex DsrMKJOP subunit DsrO [bacterium]